LIKEVKEFFEESKGEVEASLVRTDEEVSVCMGSECERIVSLCMPRISYLGGLIYL